MELLALEVHLERTTLQRLVSVRREGARQYRDKAEDRLGGLVEDVGHFVLKVLRGDQRVEERNATAAGVDADLSTGASHARVLVETLPELVDRRAGRFGSHVEQDAHVGLQHAAEGVEIPTVAVEFLFVLLFQAEDDLDRARGDLHFALVGDLHTGGVLEDVRFDRFFEDVVLHNAFVVAAHEAESLEHALVGFLSTVSYDNDHDLLPRIRTPRLGARSAAKVSNVLNDSAHGSRKEHVVFVVAGEYDRHFGLSSVEPRTEGVLLLDKLVGICGASLVAHLAELGVVAIGLADALGDGNVENKVAILKRNALDGTLAQDAFAVLALKA